MNRIPVNCLLFTRFSSVFPLLACLTTGGGGLSLLASDSSMSVWPALIASSQASLLATSLCCQGRVPSSLSREQVCSPVTRLVTSAHTLNSGNTMKSMKPAHKTLVN